MAITETQARRFKKIKQAVTCLGKPGYLYFVETFSPKHRTVGLVEVNGWGSYEAHADTVFKWVLPVLTVFEELSRMATNVCDQADTEIYNTEENPQCPQDAARAKHNRADLDTVRPLLEAAPALLRCIQRVRREGCLSVDNMAEVNEFLRKIPQEILDKVTKD